MQEYYYEAVVRVSSQHELFSDFLADTLPVGFEENESGFIIRSEDKLDTILWGLEQFREALSKALGVGIELEYEQKKLENRDWIKAYEQSIEPVEVEPFYIYPAWCEPKDGAVNIVLDPSLAFGTGHHPTTQMVLRSIAQYVKKDHKVLDIGCGSSILSIAATKLGAVVDACDTDELSIENSQKNIAINGVKLNSLWLGSCDKATDKYDVVVANIVADVLVFIANDIKKVLKDDAILIVSGILDKYEQKVLRHYGEFELVSRLSDAEWVTLALKKKRD